MSRRPLPALIAFGFALVLPGLAATSTNATSTNATSTNATSVNATSVNAAFAPNSRPHLAAARASAPIAIDGQLGDAGWAAAGRATGFAERFPGDGTEPPVQTEAWLTYDDNNLYVAFVCRDDPSLLRASMTQRDLYGGDDEVGLLLDPFGDGTWAYYFFVNPYGVQKDAMWTSVHGRDDGFDMVWSSAATRQPDGWTVEMAIPLAGMRFPDRPVQAWRLDFWRGHPRETGRQYAWSAYDRNEQCQPCQWGTVSGIEGLRPGRGLEILPSVIGYQTATIADPLDPDSGLHNEDVKGEGSLGAKFSPSSAVTLEAALNPDFSQIEADADQIDVNTTILQRYAERRPFFQEGNDLFRTMFNSFYTRMVNDPQVAAKGTARWSRTSVAWTVARDEHSPYVIPLEERSRLVAMDRSSVNVARLLHSFGSGTQGGLMVTDRRYDGGGSGTILSADANLRLSQTMSWASQVIHSRTREPDGRSVSPGATFADGAHTVDLDGESFTGGALITELRRRSRSWNFTLDFNQVSPTYRTQTGYDPWNDQRNAFVWTSYTFFPQGGVVERVAPGIFADSRWNYDGDRKWRHANLFTDINLRHAQTHVGLNYSRGEETWGGIPFTGLWQYGAQLDTQPVDALACAGYFNVGRGPAFLTLERGKEFGWGLSFTVKPLDRLILEPTVDYVRSRDALSDEVLFRQAITRLRMRLQVNPRLSLRLVLQYNDALSPFYQDLSAGGEYPDYHMDFGRKWEIDPLMTYRLNPFSVFYLGATHDLRDFNAADPGAPTLYRQTGRQYFAKLQYLWQI